VSARARAGVFAFDGYVYWEDDPSRRRKVTGVCQVCRRVMARYYGLPLRMENPYIVSPGGTIHSGGEWGQTDCGRDATGTDWWWRT